MDEKMKVPSTTLVQSLPYTNPTIPTLPYINQVTNLYPTSPHTALNCSPTSPNTALNFSPTSPNTALNFNPTNLNTAFNPSPAVRCDPIPNLSSPKSYMSTPTPNPNSNAPRCATLQLSHLPVPQADRMGGTAAHPILRGFPANEPPQRLAPSCTKNINKLTPKRQNQLLYIKFGVWSQ